MEERWGWYQQGGSSAHGPFPSEADAREDARGHFDDDTIPDDVTVDRVRDVSASDWVSVDIDALLDLADERFCQEVETSDPVFYIDKTEREAAEADLQARVQEWASKWVGTNIAWTVGA
jgi:hypothetical protein